MKEEFPRCDDFVVVAGFAVRLKRAASGLGTKGLGTTNLV